VTTPEDSQIREVREILTTTHKDDIGTSVSLDNLVLILGLKVNLESLDTLFLEIFRLRLGSISSECPDTVRLGGEGEMFDDTATLVTSGTSDVDDGSLGK
jgi:hypothetical protein